jgi:hypothetical protein
MRRTGGRKQRPGVVPTVSSQVAAKIERRKQEIPAQAASAFTESSFDESRVSAGIAFVDRASMVGPADGSYQAIFASMAHENARRQSKNAIAVCRYGRTLAGRPCIREFYHVLNSREVCPDSLSLRCAKDGETVANVP